MPAVRPEDRNRGQNPMNEIWLKCNDIPGSSTNKQHADAWPILDVSWGSQRQVSGTVQGAGYEVHGRPEMGPVIVEKEVDVATSVTMLKHIKGETLKELEISFVKPHKGQQEVYYKLKLTNPVVRSVTILADGSRPYPVERVEFVYSKAEWEYTGSDKTGGGKGKLAGSYDLETGEAK